MRRRLPLARLLDQATAAPPMPRLDDGPPIDASRWFICPTATPLYYCPVYRELTDPQRRTYNQFTAMSFSELIALFESVGSAALRSMLDRRVVDGELADCLRAFIDDEQLHIERWRELNRFSDDGYATTDHRINVNLPRLERRLKRVAHRPERWTVIFWLMLMQEERSIDLSRRCVHMDKADIEPRYRQMYAHHLRDEARHVLLDWHLIERCYERQSSAMRRVNAALLRFMVHRFFLPPVRSAGRVIARLIERHAELAPLRRTMLTQLAGAAHDPAYRTMMYSPHTMPITFALLERYPEMGRLRLGLTCDAATPVRSPEVSHG